MQLRLFPLLATVLASGACNDIFAQDASDDVTSGDVESDTLGTAPDVTVATGDAADDADAAAPKPATDPAARALDELAARSSEPLDATFEDGAPRSIRMRVPLPAGPDVVSRALSFFEAHKDLYGIADPRRDLVPLAGPRTVEGTTRIHFRQYLLGFPVVGARLSLHLRDDEVRWSTGSWSTLPPESGGPIIEPDEAIAAMRAAASDADDVTVRSPPRLVWYVPTDGRPTRPVLTWTMRIQKLGRTYQGYLHARRKTLVALISDLHEIDWEIDTANNDYSNTCFWMTSSDDLWFTEDGPDGYPGADADAYLDGQETQDVIGTIYDWFHNRFGWDSYDNDGSDIYLVVHAGDPDSGSADWRNAGWSQDCELAMFGDSFATFDIVAHEYTHGVIRASSNLRYEDESGSLNESMADLFAAFVTGSWVIGETIDLASGQRDLVTPTADGRPAHMNQYLVTDADHGGVHTNSAIPARAVAIMTRPEARVGLELEVPGMSDEEVSCLLFVVMVHVLSENSTFDDVAWAMLGALRNRECNVEPTADRQCTIINAYATVGLGNPDTDCDGLRDWNEDLDADGDGRPDVADNCPGDKNPGQVDLDGDRLGDACDGDDDGDRALDERDNCPQLANADQQDTNANGIGDACDDGDGDFIPWSSDNCPNNSNPTQRDQDDDGRGDACDSDLDGDGFNNANDSCPTVPSATLDDADLDRVGDACDNCPSVDNTDQLDCDGDGVGKACVGTTGPAARSERLCELREQTEHLGVGLEATASFDIPLPLPACMGCEVTFDPTLTYQVLLTGAAIGDLYVIVDQDGQLESRAPRVVSALETVTLEYRPGYAGYYLMPGTTQVLRERTFYLQQVARGDNEAKVTMTVGASTR